MTSKKQFLILTERESNTENVQSLLPQKEVPERNSVAGPCLPFAALELRQHLGYLLSEPKKWSPHFVTETEHDSNIENIQPLLSHRRCQEGILLLALTFPLLVADKHSHCSCTYVFTFAFTCSCNLPPATPAEHQTLGPQALPSGIPWSWL